MTQKTIDKLKLAKQPKVVDKKAQCRYKREVKSCKDCCRYKECQEGVLPDWNYEAMVRLGNAIVEDIGRAYCQYYKSGSKGLFNLYRNILLSTYPSRITANTTDGEALENKLYIKCREKYGDFEELHKKRIAKYSKLIAEQKALLKKTNDVKERKKIRDKIEKLTGDMYE